MVQLEGHGLAIDDEYSSPMIARALKAAARDLRRASRHAPLDHLKVVPRIESPFDPQAPVDLIGQLRCEKASRATRQMTPSSHRMRIRINRPPRPMYIYSSRFRVAAETATGGRPFQSFRYRDVLQRYYFTRPQSAGFA